MWTRGCTRALSPAPQGSRAGVGCYLSEVLTELTLCLSVTLHTPHTVAPTLHLHAPQIAHSTDYSSDKERRQSL